MRLVIPVEEGTCPSARILYGTKTVRIAGSILERLELRLAERIIVGGVGTGVAGAHTEVVQQQRQRLGAHRAAVVGVQDERVALDTLTRAGGFDQVFGK